MLTSPEGEDTQTCLETLWRVGSPSWTIIELSQPKTEAARTNTSSSLTITSE
jgi:hypothetical protein